MNEYQFSAGEPFRLGAHHDGAGVNFAVFSQYATRMDLCLFSPDGKEELKRLALPECSGSVWHGYLKGLPVGTLYGYRAHGTYDPQRGFRFNANKLLMDPYTRELSGSWINSDVLTGYDEQSEELDLSFDSRDSASFVPKSVVSDPSLFKEFINPNLPEGDHGDTLFSPANDACELIYEAHVKGLTQQHDLVPNEVKGTYEGLACDEMIRHYQALGVTTLELLPVHSFVNDRFLLERGLVNYWGYNTIGFFAPEPRYFGPDGLIGFRKMAQKLNSNGIKVILDVVYNHTAEGDHCGPTLSYRGLDNHSYYRLEKDQPSRYVNDTGCGNTLNIAHPFVLRMVLDSLRFWVECMGVDGFRFDLATTLGREDHGFDINGGFFDALRQDPVLSKVRLIAEPWDIGPGGYQLGEFSPEFSEWNDQFRDSVRKFWKSDANGAQEIASGLLGSASYFDRVGRRSNASLNFVSAHDGFTLADTCRYVERHNLDNGEDNRDGHHTNHSDNFGVEGESDDAEIMAMRAQRQRNILAILFLAQGSPMLLAGDEIGNSQKGNNNAYCQDNETGWINWQQADKNLSDFVARLSAFRRAHQCLSQSLFLHGELRSVDGNLDVKWTDFDDNLLNWDDPGLGQLCVLIREAALTPGYRYSDDAVLVVINRDHQAAMVKLPELLPGTKWKCGIDTADHPDNLMDGEFTGSVSVAGNCVAVFFQTDQKVH
ncbi:MAG: glycogen debranching protein GlgX [Hyphomicrobiales bacterium]|nr:glycogen debranching protein GlgX [Hyphomicrobiales bacterium]